jgi:hypothetical protein
MPNARRVAVALTSLVLGLAGACSSSKPMSSSRDAAPEARADVANDATASTDVIADTVAPPDDLATVIRDAPADPAADKDGARADSVADLLVLADVLVPADVPAAETARDTGAPDVADARADLGAAEAGRDSGDGPLDTAGDLATACTPGMDQTCNDNDLVSSVWGSCRADGTCACKVGFTINPATGRCMIGARDAGTYDALGSCTGDFLACGCGCCGGTTPNNACYYPALGESTALFQAQDEAVRQSTNCNLAGCSMGRRYVCCVAGAPEPVGSATYTASAYSGDLDHLTIVKVGTDCATLGLSGPGTNIDDRKPLQTNGNWSQINGRFGGCADGAAVDTANGVLGTLVVRKDGSGGCVADVHVSLFALATTGEAKTTRLDADGLAIGGMGADLCRW